MDRVEIDVGTLEHWSPQEVANALESNDVVLIDVRTPQEYNLERINGSLLSPMQSFNPNRMPNQTGKRIVFHCGSGKRSEKIARKCLENGCDSIAHMQGGLAAWKSAGLPYVETDVTTGAPNETTCPKK